MSVGVGVLVLVGKAVGVSDGNGIGVKVGAVVGAQIAVGTAVAQAVRMMDNDRHKRNERRLISSIVTVISEKWGKIAASNPKQ